jgi:hypothetical protein
MPIFADVVRDSPAPTLNDGSTSIASEDQDGLPKSNVQPPQVDMDPETKAAILNLQRTELLAFASCIVAPLLGGWLLHYIREFLSRPSGGLVSSFNITLFVMAAELRPTMKLMEMIKQRSLYLQRLVHQEMLESNAGNLPFNIETINERIVNLENMIEELRMALIRIQGGREEVVTTVKEGVRADLEALNRIPFAIKQSDFRSRSSVREELCAS